MDDRYLISRDDISNMCREFKYDLGNFIKEIRVPAHERIWKDERIIKLSNRLKSLKKINYEYYYWLKEVEPEIHKYIDRIEYDMQEIAYTHQTIVEEIVIRVVEEVTLKGTMKSKLTYVPLWTKHEDP